MPDFIADLHKAHPRSRDEKLIGIVDAVIATPDDARRSRYGGWVGFTSDAVYVGRQGALGMGRTKAVQRIEWENVVDVTDRPSSSTRNGLDVAFVTTDYSFLATVKDASLYRRYRQQIGVASSRSSADAEPLQPDNDWAAVTQRLTPDETRVDTTVALYVVDPHRVKSRVFLTDERLLVAIVGEPFATEAKPVILDIPIASITRMFVTDDGNLVIFNPDSFGSEASNTLDLFPSAQSQALLESLRSEWQDVTDNTVEGDWEPWLGNSAPLANRTRGEWFGHE